MRCATRVLVFTLLAACAAVAAAAQESLGQYRWLPATAEKLPRWRGFNLLEKFFLTRERQPFLEDDFRLISKLGFNFVRLPMDYRCWIKDGNWEEFDEAALREIDQAVAWGGKYGIHVSINFHLRSRLYGRPAAGADQPLDRRQDPGRLRRALGHVRPPLPRHSQRAAELQLDERAGRRRREGLRRSRR